MNRVIDFRLFNAVVWRTEEALHRLNTRKSEFVGLNGLQARQFAAAEEFMSKVIRNRDLLPSNVTLLELLKRGLFEWEQEGMLRDRLRFPEIIEDLELMVPNKGMDEKLQNERRICLDLLHWMAEKRWK
jgi:hypothetical protein